ncbi:MAG: GNAT family protein [Parafilimonas sp.]
MIKLERFDKNDYDDLISWIDSEETLMQIAGPIFSFPLTHEQLDESLQNKNRFAFNVIDLDTNENIGHCEIYLTDVSAKLDHIIIGKELQRGKGVGKQIVNALVEFVFNNFDRSKIELNVFDWNVAAIKSYEKVGFKINPDKKLEQKIKGQTWTAFNMILNNEDWKEIILKK